MQKDPNDDDEPEFQHPDFGGMSITEYGEWLEEQGEALWGEPVEFEISPNLGHVVSVRFNKGELGLVADAAEEAGVKLSTFIRQVVLSQVKAPGAGITAALALYKEREAIEAAAKTLSTVARHLRAVPAPGSPEKGAKAA